MARSELLFLSSGNRVHSLFDRITPIEITVALWPAAYFYFQKMLFAAIHLLSHDDALGRFDIASMSDQAMMELLVGTFHSKSKRKLKAVTRSMEYVDIARWACVISSDSGEVTGIRFQNETIGEINLQYIPKGVKRFEALGSTLAGTLETSALPHGLVVFYLVVTRNFTGTVEMTKLPKPLEELNITGNEFAGSADLSALPPHLVMLNISGNRFSGMLVLNALPDSLKEIQVSCNNLRGSLDFSRIPKNLQIFFARGNAFSGSFSLLNAPLCFTELSVADNEISGTCTVSRSVLQEIGCLYAEGNRGITFVDENGKVVEESVLRSLNR